MTRDKILVRLHEIASDLAKDLSNLTQVKLMKEQAKLEAKLVTAK